MIEVKKLPYDYRLAFEVEKELIRLHPNAGYIRVNPHKNGLVAEVEENGQHLDVSQEMTAYLNRELLAPDG